MTTIQDYSAFLIEHLPLIRSIVRDLGLRRHLSPQDTDELLGEVQLKLIRDDYKVLRSFRGESSFATFLRIIVASEVTNLVRQRLGNWRPSASARRAGPWAERFEALCQRDGQSRDDAQRQLDTEGFAVEPAAIDRLESQWPQRMSRSFTDPSTLEQRPSTEPSPEARILGVERFSARARALVELRRALDELPPSDKFLLVQFHGGAKAEQLTAFLPGSPSRRQVFHHIEKLRKALRKCLERAGVDAKAVRDWVSDDLPESDDPDRLS